MGLTLEGDTKILLASIVFLVCIILTACLKQSD